jgi:DNA-binding beta-propeller fold protein YncE
MRDFDAKRAWRAVFCAALVAFTVGAGAAPAWGAASDPLFVFVPVPPPPPGSPTLPPTGYLNGPCGLAADSSGRLYVSDYYHHAVDVFNPPASPFKSPPGYAGQLAGVDPLDGPCGLAFDATNHLYLNDYHRNVAKFDPFPSFGAGTSFPLPSEDPANHLPTGVAVDPATGYVYVDNRTYVSVYDSAGNPVLDEGEPLVIGEGSLGDGYGLALSQFPGIPETLTSPAVLSTLGRLYVPDAATDTVKVFDPAIDKANPVEVIDAHATPKGAFTSLRDSAIAVDRASGKVYVADEISSPSTEKPQATIQVFNSVGTYKGHLKYNIADALPPGLAVDNSATAGQGRVYVTSGNTNQAGVYAYPPGAETQSQVLPPTAGLSVRTSGSGGGAITSSAPAPIECATACEAQIRSGAEVSLTATPDPGSIFAGWSEGGCEGGESTCTVAMDGATSVNAEFKAVSGPPASGAGTGGGEAGAAAAGPPATASGTIQRDSLRLTLGGELSPRKLPRSGDAPIAVSVGWSIATTDGSAVPKLRKLRVEINRHGRFDSTGLPVCPVNRIQPASSSRALAACRPALVGKGTFTAEVALRGQEAYAAQGRLLVFNGQSHGRPVLLGQIYSPHPFPTSFVIPFAVKKLAHGTYGTALDATLPKSLAAWGNLTGIEMTLSRRYGFGGKRHSYISAGCPAPKGFSKATFALARTSFDFGAGTKLSSAFTSTCRARGK